MQQVETGQGEFQFAARTPSQPRIELHIAGRPGIGQRADSAQVCVERPAIGEIHHRADETLAHRIVAGLGRSEQRGRPGLDVQLLAQNREARAELPAVVDGVTAPGLHAIGMACDLVAPVRGHQRGWRKLQCPQVVIDVVEHRNGGRRARGNLAAPARLPGGDFLAPEIRIAQQESERAIGADDILFERRGGAHRARSAGPQQHVGPRLPRQPQVGHQRHTGIGVVLGLQPHRQLGARGKRDLVLDEGVGEILGVHRGIPQIRAHASRGDGIAINPVADAPHELVVLAQGHILLKFDIPCTEREAVPVVGVAQHPVVERPHLETGVFAGRVPPACDHVGFAVALVGGRPLDATVVGIALQHQAVCATGIPVDPECQLRVAPAVMRVAPPAIVQCLATEIPCVDPVVGMRAQRSAVLHQRAALQVAHVDLQHAALGVRALAGDDVDDAADRIGTPQRATRPADHLDAFDGVGGHVLVFPVHAGEDR